MSTEGSVASPPVIAVMGGAGAMGSLFAELFVPSVTVALLVDRFAQVGEEASTRPVAMQPLLDRLVPLLVAPDTEHIVLAADEAGKLFVATSREVRRVPAFLAACERGASAGVAAALVATTSLHELMQRSAALGVRRLVALLPPSAAPDVAALTDVLVIATTYTSSEGFRASVAPYAARLRPGSLVANLLSIQEQPMADLGMAFPANVGLLGAHPLFGRVVGDVTGLVLAVTSATDGRPTVRWEGWLLRRLAARGLLMTPSTAAEHDAAMSYVQALTHFCLLTFAFTFVRANQDPTSLLPYRTPVFEPLLYLAARVASLAQRSPDVYRAIQAECARPELRTLFVDTAEQLLAAINRDGEAAAAQGADAPSATASVSELFQTWGAPWSPTYHLRSEPYEHLIAMSGVLTERVNTLRFDLLQLAGKVCGLRQRTTGAVTVGALYVDPLHHDRVDLASRVRFRRFNISSGLLEGVDPANFVGVAADEARTRLEASLGSLPLAHVELLSDGELLNWLDAATASRTGADESGGQRPRYAGKARFDLSLLVPSWLDEECLNRLLAGQARLPELGAGLLAQVALVHQELPWQPPTGLLAALLTVTVLLHPEETLALRNAAHEQTQRRFPELVALRRRQQEDRAFAAALSARHASVRDAVLAWLLAHGCQAPSRPTGTAALH